MEKLATYIEEHMLSCSYNKFLGIDCPGCGFQRSLVFLLRGEFADSFKMFPALIPVLGMLLFLIVHLIVKFKAGHKVILTLFIANVSIMLTHFILKLT